MPTSFGIVSPSCLPGPSPSQEPAAYLASVVDEFLAAEGSGEEVSVKQVSLSSLARISPLPALDADSRPTSKRRLNPAVSFENRTRTTIGVRLSARQMEDVLQGKIYFSD